MKNPYAIGIDLGTSTSEISIYRHGEPILIPDSTSPTKSPVVPSLVALNTRGELLVGEEAIDYVDVPGYGIREVKRKMGSGEFIQLSDKSYRPEEISALILKKLKENAEEMLGIEVKDVVLSVPAFFPNAARQATYNAGELAGLNIMRLISEPTAAALSYGIQHIDAEEQLVVFDFGGGTLDISVLEMMAGVLEVKSSFGDHQLGGKDVDEAMISLILRKFKKEVGDVSINARARAELKKVAERAKIHLTSHTYAPVQLHSFAFRGQELIDLQLEVTRSEFEAEIQPLLDKAKLCIERALQAKQVSKSQIDRILLVGGTTYIPIIRQFVAEMFGKEPTIDHPDFAVARGTAIQAGLATGLIDNQDGIIMTDVAPYGLGIRVVEDLGGRMRPYYSSLIKPNTVIPYSTVKEYSLLYIDQEQVEISLYQDPTGQDLPLSQMIDTEISATISNIPPSYDGRSRALEVQFSYDINGIATIHASIPSTGQSADIIYQYSPKNMNEEEKTTAVVRVNDLWKQHKHFEQYEGVLQKAEEMLHSIPLKHKDKLLEGIVSLKAALSSDDEEQIKESAGYLIDMLFFLEHWSEEE